METGDRRREMGDGSREIRERETGCGKQEAGVRRCAR